MIKHASGYFLVNKWIKAVTGFERNSLVGGRDLNEVRREVEERLKNKLVRVVQISGL